MKKKEKIEIDFNKHNAMQHKTMCNVLCNIEKHVSVDEAKQTTSKYPVKRWDL